MSYAANTEVSVERSRMELERTLTKYGAEAFAYGTMPGRAFVEFAAHARRVRFTLALPVASDRKFTHHSRGARTATAAAEAWEQACRQKWRALNLVVKAKLEAVEAGISEFEDEFLANIVMPDNNTAGFHVRAAIETAYRTGMVPPMLQIETRSGSEAGRQ